MPASAQAQTVRPRAAAMTQWSREDALRELALHWNPRKMADFQKKSNLCLQQAVRALGRQYHGIVVG